MAGTQRKIKWNSEDWQIVNMIAIGIYLPVYTLWLSYISVYYSYLACLLAGVVLGTRITNYINKKDSEE